MKLTRIGDGLYLGQDGKTYESDGVTEVKATEAPPVPVQPDEQRQD